MSGNINGNRTSIAEGLQNTVGAVGNAVWRQRGLLAAATTAAAAVYLSGAGHVTTCRSGGFFGREQCEEKTDPLLFSAACALTTGAIYGAGKVVKMCRKVLCPPPQAAAVFVSPAPSARCPDRVEEPTYTSIRRIPETSERAARLELVDSEGNTVEYLTDQSGRKIYFVLSGRYQKLVIETQNERGRSLELVEREKPPEVTADGHTLLGRLSPLVNFVYNPADESIYRVVRDRADRTILKVTDLDGNEGAVRHATSDRLIEAQDELRRTVGTDPCSRDYIRWVFQKKDQ